jgi:hypothetical protein
MKNKLYITVGLRIRVIIKRKEIFVLLNNNIKIIVILTILTIELGFLILKDFISNIISVNGKQRRFIKIIKRINIYVGLIIYLVIV